MSLFVTLQYMKKSSPQPPVGGADDDPGARILDVLHTEDAANKAFEGAGVQFFRLMMALEDPAETGKPPGEWSGEVFRRLMDFLNNAHALMALTGEMAALIGERPVHAQTPAGSFLEELRTCMKHRATPRMALTQHPPPSPQKCVLRMELLEMISWPHWSASARRFLHLHQPALPLHAAVQEYQQMLRMFRQRTLRTFRENFSEILAAAPPLPVMMHIM